MDGHTYYSANAIAVMLDARPNGDGFRARCPVHGGDNPSSLSIRTKLDRDGYPVTMMKCFSQDCDVRDICTALGIPFVGLWSVIPSKALKACKRPSPPYRPPAIRQFAQQEEPGTPDDVLFLLLLSSLVGDYGETPDTTFLRGCEPARRELWRLIQEPERRKALCKALQHAQINPIRFLRQLEDDANG